MPATLGPLSPGFLLTLEVALLASAWCHLVAAHLARFDTRRAVAKDPTDHNQRRALVAQSGVLANRRLALTFTRVIAASLPIVFSWAYITG